MSGVDDQKKGHEGDKAADIMPDNLGRIRTILEQVDTLIDQIACGNTALVPLLMDHFKTLADIPVQDVYAAMEIPWTSEMELSMPLRCESPRRNIKNPTLLIYLCMIDLRSSQRDCKTLSKCARLLFREIIYKLLDKLDEIVPEILNGDYDRIDEFIATCEEFMEIKSDHLKSLFDSDLDERQAFTTTLHDVRSIISTLKGFSDLLRGKLKPEKRTQFTDRLRENHVGLRAVRHCFEEFFDPTEPTPEELPGLLASATKAIDRMMTDAGISDCQILVEANDSFKSTSIAVNRTHFIEAMKNFVRNSYDAKNPSGPCVVTINISPYPRDTDYVLFTIRDNGRGIDSEKLPEIQKMCVFRTANIPPRRRRLLDIRSDHKTFGGQGTGLSGSLHALRNMGGFFEGVEQTCELGGAEFRICLRKANVLR